MQKRYRSNELLHYGMKGMKWGVRRYQNKDGSLTNAGKKRYAQDKLDQNNDKLAANPNKWVKEDISRSKKLVDASSDMTRTLKTANNSRSASKTKMDLSKMTDQEMRNQINRALLEKQYNDMFAPQKTSRGKETLNKILDTSGTVLAIGSSALGIALAIKELRLKN